MGESSDDRADDREMKLDLLQRRLHNRTQRTIHVVQFNIVSLTLIAGLIEVANPPRLQWNPMIIVGASAVAVSILLSISGITLNGVPLPWSDTSGRDGVNSLVSEYESRNRYLGWLMPAALSTGAFGVALLLIGVVRVVEIVPALLPWWASTSGIFVLIVGGVVIGYRLSRRDE